MSSVRDAFFNRIYELTKQGEDIYIVTADLGAPSLDAFRQDFPQRYISVGIAEQSLISVSAGMALAGKKVVAYGLNPFPVTRAFDQIRCLLSDLNIPLTVCALNAGLCSAECGYTHVPIEDMAMLRTLGSVETYNPTDEAVSEKIAEDTLTAKCPRVIRFDKSLQGKIYRKDTIDFKRGFSLHGNRNAKIALITSGCYAKELTVWMEENNFAERIKLLDIYKLPVDSEMFVAELRACNKIITVEENVLPCGLGSMVLEILSDKEICVPVIRLGLDVRRLGYKVFADRQYIRKDHGITLQDIEETVRKALED